MQSAERYVAVSEMPAEQAPGTLQLEGEMDVPKPVEFNEYQGTYFRAEYTPDGRDIIIHFFVADALRKQWTVDAIEHWWLNDFAAALSRVATEYFQATVPRIMAKYTPEMASWWFKAQGYDFLLDRAAYLNAFFELLDGTLHSALHPQGASPSGTA
jgi:hypothetical protein